MSGDVIRNAVMDLRRIALRRPKRRGRAVALSVTRPITASAIARLFAIAWLLEAEGPRTAGAGLRLDPTSRAQEALDLVLGPGQCLLPRLALEVAHRHLGHDTLDVNLPHDLRRGAWRVHDQRAAARDQRFVVGGIVPRRRIRREEFR